MTQDLPGQASTTGTAVHAGQVDFLRRVLHLYAALCDAVVPNSPALVKSTHDDECFVNKYKKVVVQLYRQYRYGVFWLNNVERLTYTGPGEGFFDSMEFSGPGYQIQLKSYKPPAPDDVDPDVLPGTLFRIRNKHADLFECELPTRTSRSLGGYIIL